MIQSPTIPSNKIGYIQNSVGAIPSPNDCFLVLRGIKTLHIRMDRHCENALKLAKYLETHEMVEWVNYAGLDSSPYQQLAKEYAGGKPSGILSFGIKGGKEAGIKFIDALNLVTRLVNIGDTKSLATHPASTTHSQLDEADYHASGISADMVRVSVGIEHIADIIDDIEQAIQQSQKPAV